MTASKPIYEQVFTVDMDKKVDVPPLGSLIGQTIELFKSMYISKGKEKEDVCTFLTLRPHLASNLDFSLPACLVRILGNAIGKMQIPLNALVFVGRL